jgi:hypothetical protein
MNIGFSTGSEDTQNSKNKKSNFPGLFYGRPKSYYPIKVSAHMVTV